MIIFFVPGLPAPGGSKRGFAIKRQGQYTGRVAIIDAAGQRNKDWKGDVKVFAAKAMMGYPPTDLPLIVFMTFYMPRPLAHFGTGKNSKKLKASSPAYHVKKPDSLKLMRSTEDAMSSVVWNDDNQNVTVIATKVYVTEKTKPGAMIKVKEIRSIGDLAPYIVQQ